VDELLDILAYIYKIIELYPQWIPLLINDEADGNMPTASTGESLGLPF
jgi:hypothetical protein